MIFHSISEGFRNLFRSFWLSITAIFIIFVSLSSVALVSSLWVATGFFLRQLDNQAVLYVNLKSDTSPETKDIMLQDIQNVKEVKEVTFVDKEAAKRELKNNEIAGKEIESLETTSEITRNSLENVQESFRIVASSAETYQNVLTFIKQEKYSLVIASIIDISKSIEYITYLYRISGIVGLILVLTFALISVLVMINILRIAIYSRKDEIEIMRLVGATNNYIRGPFIFEGVLYNLIATGLALALFIPAYIYFAPQLKSFLGLEINSSTDILLTYLYLSLLVTIAINLIIGACSSYLATQKYLKL